MTAYYNEFDPYAAQWLRNLISAGLIADGFVDETDIRKVEADEIRGFTQYHFFAGIGGWSLALRLAGWPDDKPVWTGSCPCQPFSRAGKQAGVSDERHLWPNWLNLIRKLRPTTIFGEQVEAAINEGWLDEVAAGLEGSGYAFGAAVLSSVCVESPHGRERIFFVGDTKHYGLHEPALGRGAKAPIYHHAQGEEVTEQPARTGTQGMLAANAFSGIEWIPYPDGKLKAVRPYIPLFSDGVSNGMAKFRAIGNAIVPQIAAEFIRAAG